VASAVLRDASSKLVGTALFTEGAEGVRVTLRVQGLPPGGHGLHIHAVGQCDGPDFTSAGPHFNPTNAQHGLQNPAGPHAGDLPQLTVGPTGSTVYSAVAASISLGTETDSIFDADRSALVIHAAPDDQRTDPAGNAGARTACGIIVRGAVALPDIPAAIGGLPATGDGTMGPPGGTTAGTGVASDPDPGEESFPAGTVVGLALLAVAPFANAAARRMRRHPARSSVG
jgi:Cu-Zn family superoxide dismutase